MSVKNRNGFGLKLERLNALGGPQISGVSHEQANHVACCGESIVTKAVCLVVTYNILFRFGMQDTSLFS